MRRAFRVLLWILGVVAAPLLLVLIYVLIVGLVEDRDFGSAWRALVAEYDDFTVDPASLERAPFGDPVFAGVLGSPQLREASGLAASRRRDDLLWALNDGGHEPRLYPLLRDGRDRGSFLLPEGEDWNEDWEDLASFELDGRPYLLIADVGDNYAWTKTRRLLVVEEPVLRGSAVDWGSPVEIAWSVRFRYPDGPRDCEAVAVDPTEGAVYLLAKRTVPNTLYRLPLRPAPGAQQPLLAEVVAQVANLPQPTPEERDVLGFFGRYFGMPTALDFSPDGREALVLTYKQVYVYARGEGESWPDAFARPPRFIPMPPLRQAEAASYARDGLSVFVTSEFRPSPLFRADRR